MKKILIKNGHPNNDSFNFGLFAAYKKGAQTAGADLKEIVIKYFKFNPNLQFGYQKRTDFEPELSDA
jgi:NAD(P)H dehydrogenase (quinone)